MNATPQEVPHMMIGKPAEPFPPKVIEAISTMLRLTGQVAEAHLPHCLLPSQSPDPFPGLFLVFKAGIDPDPLVEELQSVMRAALVLPVERDSELYSAVAGAECQLQL